MVNDPIADMLIRIKNARAVGKSSVRIPLSHYKLALAKFFKKIGILKVVKTKDNWILADLGQAHFDTMRRVSHLGQRIYVKSRELKPAKFGFLVISTPKGLMTDHEAKAKGIGGEVICEVR